MIPLFLNMSSGTVIDHSCWLLVTQVSKRDLIKNQSEIPEHVVNVNDSSLGKHDYNMIVLSTDMWENRRKLRYEEAMNPAPIVQLYNQLVITRQNIEKQLPLFHDIIVLLE